MIQLNNDFFELFGIPEYETTVYFLKTEDGNAYLTWDIEQVYKMYEKCIIIQSLTIDSSNRINIPYSKIHAVGMKENRLFKVERKN